EVTLRLRRGDEYTLVDTTGPNLCYHPEKLSTHRVGDAAFGPEDRLGEMTLRNHHITHPRARLEQCAARGFGSGPTSELVGSLEAGGAEEIANSGAEVDEAGDLAGLAAAFDTGTD